MRFTPSMLSTTNTDNYEDEISCYTLPVGTEGSWVGCWECHSD